MQKLFDETGSLDRRCYDEFGLSEDLLMEHAADGMADYVRARFKAGSHVQIVCGSGNNGADGIALGRLLFGKYRVSLLLPRGANSPMARLQLKRAKAIGLKPASELHACDVLVDALFGSGFSRAFDDETAALLRSMNALDAFKLACDMPSGLHADGQCESEAFYADATLSMGALKLGMFSDAAKAHVGQTHVVDLGVSRSVYESDTPWRLLESEDLRLPTRDRPDTHKGSYGHLALVCGEKPGAAVMAGMAALRFGTGLVTLVSNENVSIPYELMQSHLLPPNASAMVLGMGLGQEFGDEELEALLNNDLPLLLDADIISHPLLPGLLRRERLVVTPHPREFTSLLRACGIADIGVDELQRHRFKYVERFAQAYPRIVLVLKGANVIISAQKRHFVNPHGTNVLAKGGSGDVLAGLIGALLAQGYAPLEAAVHGSLAHTMCARRFDRNNYALTPMDLIESIAIL